MFDLQLLYKINPDFSPIGVEPGFFICREAAERCRLRSVIIINAVSADFGY